MFTLRGLIGAVFFSAFSAFLFQFCLHAELSKGMLVEGVLPLAGKIRFDIRLWIPIILFIALETSIGFLLFWDNMASSEVRSMKRSILPILLCFLGGFSLFGCLGPIFGSAYESLDFLSLILLSHIFGLFLFLICVVLEFWIERRHPC